MRLQCNVRTLLYFNILSSGFYKLWDPDSISKGAVALSAVTGFLAGVIALQSIIIASWYRDGVGLT